MKVSGKTDPATEAWSTFLAILFSERPPRFPAVAAEFGVSPLGLRMLHILEPGAGMPMSALAAQLHCDASNVTGMVDRLEDRGLLERREDSRDRRVKRIALTDAGEDARERMLERLHEPPEALTRLSSDDQQTLRDVLRRAVEG